MDASIIGPLHENIQYGMPTTCPQQCHRMSIHSFLLQQLSTTASEPARRNTIQSLHDHIK